MSDKLPVIVEISTLRRDWDAARTREYIETLPIWAKPVTVTQKFGGLQNRTYFVTDGNGNRFVVRTGFDQFRTRQTSVVECTAAAHRLGLGPELIYAEPNLSVTAFAQGRQLELEEMKDRAVMANVIAAMKVLHEGTGAVHETISYWWPFDTIRRYLRTLTTGRAATGWQPSRWADEVPRLSEIVDRLERAIGPYKPRLTHNDMVFVNIFRMDDGSIQFIDWDGGAYGHPMWDLGEMLMWAEADDDLTRFAIREYHGECAPAEEARLLRELHAFQIAAALRLCTETMEANLDPFFYLTPEEMAESMKVSLPGERPELEGLVDLLRPRFDELWAQYQHEFLP